jgi:predicted nucleotidyltransferase
MFINDEIKKKIPDFEALCRNHKVKYIYAFGSAVSGKFNTLSSDIDLLIEIDASDPLERGEYLLILWDIFEARFQRKVDLLTESSIKNPYLKKSIDASKVLIYDRASQKIPG